MEFLEHAVKFAFPAQMDRRTLGVPTAYSGPALAGEIMAEEPLVWPDANGSTVGQAMIPLYEKAAELPSKCPYVYEMLTLVDAVRVGRARERSMAVTKLRERLSYKTPWA